MYLKAFYRVLPLLVETCGHLLFPSYCSLCSSNTLSMEGKEASSSSKKKEIRMATLLSKKLILLTLYACLFIEKLSPHGALTGPTPHGTPSRSQTPRSAAQDTLDPPPMAPPPYWILQVQ